MATDPSIPLQFRGPDIGAILDHAQQLQQQRYEMGRKKASDKREDEYRSALGDILTGNGSFTPPNGGTVSGDNVPPGPSARDRAARADPEGYLKFQGQQTELTARQLKGYRDLNDTAMQLLGGVNDQGSYDRAKMQAKVLYQRYSQDPSAIDQLPPEYSPETIRSLQMQGMDTAHQLHQVAAENKLNWDMADDQADNERADENADSLSRYREGQLSNARRGQDMRGGGRGGSGGKGPQTEAAVYAGIMQKWTSGGQVNAREKEYVRSYETRHKGGGRGGRSSGGVSAGNGAIIRNPKTGQRMKLQNGQWVPIQ